MWHPLLMLQGCSTCVHVSCDAAEAEENLAEVTGLMFIPPLASLDHRVPALFKRYVGTRRGAGRGSHEAERNVG